jgi:hypothetical protein
MWSWWSSDNDRSITGLLAIADDVVRGERQTAFVLHIVIDASCSSGQAPKRLLLGMKRSCRGVNPIVRRRKEADINAAG